MKKVCSRLVLLLSFVLFFYDSFSQVFGDYHRTIKLTTTDKNIDFVIDTKSKPKVNYILDYYWYDNDLIHHSQGGFSGFLLDGEYTEYYFPGNNLASKGKFKDGLKNGTWLIWHQNGKLKELTKWKSGKMIGERKCFNENGEETFNQLRNTTKQINK